MRILVLMGLPGTGKSVVGKAIAKSKGYGYISTGDIARELKDKTWMQKGQLADENYVRTRFIEEVEKLITQEVEGIVVDGMPRTVEQVDFLASLFFSIDYVILDAEHETIFDRLYKRGREDDNFSTITKRIENQEKALRDIEERIEYLIVSYRVFDTISCIDTDEKEQEQIIKEVQEVL